MIKNKIYNYEDMAMASSSTPYMQLENGEDHSEDNQLEICSTVR